LQVAPHPCYHVQLGSAVQPAYFAPAPTASLPLFCFFQTFEYLLHFLSREQTFANEDYCALTFTSREHIDDLGNQESRHKYQGSKAGFHVLTSSRTSLTATRYTQLPRHSPERFCVDQIFRGIFMSFLRECRKP
jgi:hypothetical protein